MGIIKTETGGAKSGAGLLVVGGFASLWITISAMGHFGIRLPVPESLLLLLLELGALGVASLFFMIVVLMFIARVLEKLQHLARRTLYTAADHADRMVTTAVECGSALLASALSLASLPLRFAARRAWEATCSPWFEARRQREELRRLFEEVRDQYASFDDFVRDFEGSGAGGGNSAGKDAPDPSPDPFALACRTLGLPEDGKFTQARFKTRYQTLMKAVHPDVIGENVFATQLNQARDAVKARKGWKR